jgi:nucleotide-binding universal stress UspA family protein
MAPTETWLVAHDFSPCSDVALEEAARVVDRLGGRLFILYVHPVLRLRPEEAWGEQTFNLAETLRARLYNIAVALRERYATVQVSVDVVAANDPARGILDVARRIGADHVVVGTHGRRGLEHLVLGSVSEKVAKDAPMPVTIVRSTHP